MAKEGRRRCDVEAIESDLDVVGRGEGSGMVGSARVDMVDQRRLTNSERIADAKGPGRRFEWISGVKKRRFRLSRKKLSCKGLPYTDTSTMQVR